jgi:hypothetical protein
MSQAAEYRQLATQQRHAAAASNLPRVRSLYEQAAERWDYLAEEIERCERGLLNMIGGREASFH